MHRVIEATHLDHLLGIKIITNNRVRRCQCKECKTILTKYNTGEFCFAHSPMQTYLALLENDEVKEAEYIERTKIASKKVSTKVKEKKSWKRN